VAKKRGTVLSTTVGQAPVLRARVSLDPQDFLGRTVVAFKSFDFDD
jgi:hypothetical protein